MTEDANKAKGRISKHVFQENKARQIFRKMNISYLLIRTRTKILSFLTCQIFSFKSGNISLRKKDETRAQTERNACNKKKRVTIIFQSKAKLTQ